MICANATELHVAMMADIADVKLLRTVSDPTSPACSQMVEAEPFRSYVLRSPVHNLVTCDTRWAIANVLHFFAATEHAGILRRYNKHADRFLTGDRLVGAYGLIAVPQIRRCIELLKEDKYSRRAIVSMGALSELTVNSPPCWTSLHFVESHGKLHMGVEQRSLSMSVMPYDCVLLCNILDFVGCSLGVVPGTVHWRIGNLHRKPEHTVQYGPRNLGILFRNDLLREPWLCEQVLSHPETWDNPYAKELLRDPS